MSKGLINAAELLTLVEKALSFTHKLSFLSIHRAQHPHSGWTSNVFPRFGFRQSFNNWYRDFAHPPLIAQGIKKCEIRRRFQHHSTLSRPRLKMQQYIRTLKQIYCVHGENVVNPQ